jgi:hypothetical protein
LAVKEIQGMKRAFWFKFCLVIIVAILTTLGTAVVAIGQNEKVESVPPPPKPLPTPAKLDLGTINGFSYSNEQFGFSFSVPSTWSVRDEKAMIAMREDAKRLFRDEKDPKLKANLEASVERTTVLFSAMRLAPGTSGAVEVALSCAAERIPTAIVSTPGEYYSVMLHSLNLTEGLKVEVIEPIKTKRIGTTDFGVFTLKMTSNVGVNIQKHLIAVKGSYVYGFVYSYIFNEDVDTFDEIVNSVKSW